MKQSGFDKVDFAKSIKVLDKIDLSRKDFNRAASKALIPATKEVKKGIAGFKGTNEDGISKAMLLSRMVRRRMAKASFTAGARIIISGPDIPMGERYWNAQGVAKLLQKESTGSRSTDAGANRGEFKGEKAGGGDNYLSRFAARVEQTTKIEFERAATKIMRDTIKKAVNG